MNVKNKTPAKSKIELKNSAYWEEITNSMRSVVHSTSGTAWKSGLNAEYTFAGKTGTAQIIGIDQESEYKEEEIPDDLKDHALFIAFAPYDDPKYAISIIIEHGGSGSSAAAPIAKKVIKKVLERDELRVSQTSQIGKEI